MLIRLLAVLALGGIFGIAWAAGMLVPWPVMAAIFVIWWVIAGPFD